MAIRANRACPVSDKSGVTTLVPKRRWIQWCYRETDDASPHCHPSPHDEAGHKKQDARCSGWNVQDEEVCGERAEHDGREQRGSNSPRLRHHDQYGSGELEDARDVPKNHCPKANRGEERDHLRLPHQFRPGGADEHEREECLDAPQQNVEWAPCGGTAGGCSNVVPDLTAYLRRSWQYGVCEPHLVLTDGVAPTRLSSTPHARRTDRRRSRCPGKSPTSCSSRGPLHPGAAP